MKWLRTTSSREYIIRGKKVPNSLSGEYLEVEDPDYMSMCESPVFKSLVKTGGIVVHERKPSDMKVSNEELIRENEKLKAQLAAAKKTSVTEKETVTDEAPAVEEVQTEKKGRRNKRTNLVDEA